MGGSLGFEAKPVQSLAGLSITGIACGERHYAACDNNGDLYTWGAQNAQHNKG